GGSFSTVAPGAPGATAGPRDDVLGIAASPSAEQGTVAGKDAGVLGIRGAIAVGVACVIASGALVYYVERMLLH
ncbi:MAG: hypothetical protein L0H32_12395, partial [Micrococcaceae bacterium]|nr:hypothetical protein [Micrococcaceae bacterium]